METQVFKNLRFICSTAHKLLQNGVAESVRDLRLNQHMSYPEIAKEISLESRIRKSRYTKGNGIEESVIRYMLIGNSNPAFGEIYEGLLSETENTTISQKNRENVESRRQRNFKGSSKEYFEKRKEDVRKAALVGGAKLWSDENAFLAYCLSKSPDYRIRNNSSVNNKKIAETLTQLNIRDSNKKEVENLLYNMKTGRREMPSLYNLLDHDY